MLHNFSENDKESIVRFLQVVNDAPFDLDIGNRVVPQNTDYLGNVIEFRKGYGELVDFYIDPPISPIVRESK